MDWETTDSLLARLARFEDHEAWQRLAERFGAPIERFATKLGVPAAETADVAQESLLALARSLREGGFDPAKGRLERWLFGIVYRQSLAALRRARREQPPRTSFLDGVPDEQTASASWDLEWECALLERCEEGARASFAPESFRAYELVVREGLAPAEAARTLGLDVKSVYNAKHRVLERIRELRARLEASGPGALERFARE